MDLLYGIAKSNPGHSTTAILHYKSDSGKCLLLIKGKVILHGNTMQHCVYINHDFFVSMAKGEF